MPKRRNINVNEPYLVRLAHALAEGEKGMKLAYSAASRVWKLNTEEWLEWYVQGNPYLFTDEHWGAGIEDTDRRRALGSITQNMATRKLIKDAGTTLPRSLGHGAGGRVWESLVYDPDFDDPPPTRRKHGPKPFVPHGTPQGVADPVKRRYVQS